LCWWNSADGVHLPDKRKISFLNAYGPCSSRRKFWESVETKGILARDDLILAGDLNFTTSVDEVWGVGAFPDPLEGFFRNLFDKNHLVDVQPAELVPTWRNGRLGAHGIQKRLDRVYVSEALMVESTRYRSWVVHPFFSDHAPVFFQLEFGNYSVAYPFKFNPAILNEVSFGQIVRAEWSTVLSPGVVSAQRRLAMKLHNLKIKLKIWMTEKKRSEKQALNSLEEQITGLTKKSWESELSSEGGGRLKLLESERNKMIMEEEARWRLKSRALWIQCGDNNSKYFHHFTSYRRNKKYLWEIQDDQGHFHQGQDALKKEAKRFFSSFYQEEDENKIVEQVESVRLYPRFVNDEEVVSLENRSRRQKFWRF
jgi:hypothetical protein